ncbi:hypothetical protein SADUNF_Sadunf19G0119300 [Salix dunnii]|uniref:Uncharacterized protein n=1 Tax=Salix dunnii TaxID=1413687 RepID=A0A835IZQ3_9ROSI|nr:hypothetical protein SADUNF_Sadunf19G0119300 [Salix dunnii]
MERNRRVMLQGFSNYNSSKAATAGMVVKCSGMGTDGFIEGDALGEIQGYGEILAMTVTREATRAAHLGKQLVARWSFPQKLISDLKNLPPNAKCLVVWITEAKACHISMVFSGCN